MRRIRVLASFYGNRRFCQGESPSEEEFQRMIDQFQGENDKNLSELNLPYQHMPNYVEEGVIVWLNELLDTQWFHVLTRGNKEESYVFNDGYRNIAVFPIEILEFPTTKTKKARISTSMIRKVGYPFGFLLRHYAQRRCLQINIFANNVNFDDLKQSISNIDNVHGSRIKVVKWHNNTGSYKNNIFNSLLIDYSDVRDYHREIIHNVFKEIVRKYIDKIKSDIS